MAKIENGLEMDPEAGEAFEAPLAAYANEDAPYEGSIEDFAELMQIAVCGEAISEGVACETTELAVDGDEARFNVDFGGRTFTLVMTEVRE